MISTLLPFEIDPPSFKGKSPEDKFVILPEFQAFQLVIIP